MIIEIKDYPKDIKSVLIKEIVIEFNDSSVQNIQPSNEHVKELSQERTKERTKEDSIRDLDSPIIEDSKPELADIPEEMLNLEF